MLTVLAVEREKLPTHGLDDLAQDRLDDSLQELRVAFGHRQEHTQVIAQLLGGRADWSEDVARREPMHGQGVDDSKRSWTVLRPRVGLLDTRFENVRFLDHIADLGDRSERRVVFQGLPIRVIGDEAGLVCGHGLAMQAPDGRTERLQHLALLSDIHTLKGVEVGGMHREQLDELIHPLVHGPVQRCELRQVLAHQRLLLRILLEEPLGDHVGDIVASNAHLLEAVLDPTQAVRGELEPWVVEQTLLDTRDEAEA